MYNSPIELYCTDLKTKIEGEILTAVHRVAVYVDRDELLQALKYDRKQYEKGYAAGIGAAAREWIPVEKRLPENDQWVLCLKCDGDCWVAAWNYIDWMWSDQNKWYQEKDITHWMPLPEPPEEAE